MFAQRFAANATPEGPEFRVNALEDGDQVSASVAMRPDGGFIISYQTTPLDGRDLEVMARRFDAQGEGQEELQLNSHTASLQRNVRIAGTPSGFVAVWESYGQDGDGYGVYTRSFDETITAAAPEWMASETGERWQLAPAIAAAADGRYLIAWYETTPDGGYRLRARVFTAADPLLPSE